MGKVSKIYMMFDGSQLKKAFPCSVYSCYGVSVTIAFIIESNYIIRWLAHTFIFTSFARINSISVIIEIEFDECYKTSDINITH